MEQELLGKETIEALELVYISVVVEVQVLLVQTELHLVLVMVEMELLVA